MAAPDTPLVPYYRIVPVPYGSEAYTQHLRLVLAEYQKRGFVVADRTTVEDSHDGTDAAYYALHAPGAEDLAGTFRIIRMREQFLPTLRACPGHAIEGVASRFCESTRVVAARADAFRNRTQLPQSVLFEAVICALAYVRRHELWGVISLGSPSIFRWINGTFCNTQRTLGEPRRYEGGVVIPSIIWLDEFERNLAHDAPHLFAYYLRAVAEVAGP